MFMSQGNTIYQALSTHTILLSKINSLMVLFFSWASLTIRKNMEYLQPYLFKIIVHIKKVSTRVI